MVTDVNQVQNQPRLLVLLQVKLTCFVPSVSYSTAGFVCKVAPILE